MKHQNIAVAVPLEENLIRPLYSWGQRFNWEGVDEVHFFHIVKKDITPLDFGLIEVPDEETYKEMEPTLEKFLKDESKKILPYDFKGKVFYHIARDFNPEEETVKILENMDVSQVVVAPQGRHGFENLFHSSFTNHMVKHAPCDVYVVRAT
jgi:nucleotide-binding universal stress UspA family protein